MTSVSFVIPHKGREQFLRATLESIGAQESGIASAVILITQNQHLDHSTKQVLEKLDAQVIYAPAELTIAALRNLGVRQSNTTHLAFLDADIQLAPHWLDSMMELLQIRKDLVVTSAKQIGGEASPPLEEIRVALSNAALDAPVDFLPGRNLLLSRHNFDAVGGFPEHLITCEDYVFTDRMAALGKLWYSSDAWYIHLGEDKKLGEMFHKEIWRGQSNVQSLRGRVVALREWPSFVVPIWICLCFVLSAVSVFFMQIPLALLAALAAFAPYTAYVMRLYFLAEKSIPLRHIAAFYGYYFPARAWGSIVGAFHSLGKNLHNQ